MSVARWGAALFLLAACTTPGASPSRDEPASAWRYRVRVDPALTRLTAELCFEGVVPRELRAGKDEAAGALSYARWLSPGARRKLPVRQGRVQLPSELRDGCMEYAVDLGESGSLDAATRRVGRDLLASPNAWLWRPERRTADAHATLRLELPAGIAALLPWPRREDGSRALDVEAFRFDSYAAFGHFTPITAREGDVEIEAAALDGALGVDRDAMARVLRSAVRVASLSSGSFPRSRLAAVVIPTYAQREPVPFGMVARGGAASVLLIVSASARERELLRDWVLPHELSHLLLPFVEREHAWLSEGFATYYQELLLARAGLIGEREALLRMADSLHEASQHSEMLSVVDESARCARGGGARDRCDYRALYWGGAAWWLSLDVALRTHEPAIDLDALLAGLRAQEATREVWTAAALMERLDALSGTSLFSSAFARAASEPFPAHRRALERLGVSGRGATLELQQAGAALRRQLLAR